MSLDFIFKIIIVGDGGVGKTTMLRRFVEGKFIFDTKMTIGVEIFNKMLYINGGKVASLQLWDFGGQERFRFFQDSFVLGARGAFLMFDLTNYNSFNNLDNWLNIARKYNPTLPIILIGSKLDLINDFSIKDDLALEFKEKNNLNEYIKISSKTGFNVDHAFYVLTNILIEYKSESKTFASNEI